MAINDKVKALVSDLLTNFIRQKRLAGVRLLYKELDKPGNTIGKQMIAQYKQFEVIADEARQLVMKERDNLDLMLNEFRVLDQDSSSIRKLSKEKKKIIILL